MQKSKQFVCFNEIPFCVVKTRGLKKQESTSVIYLNNKNRILKILKGKIAHSI